MDFLFFIRFIAELVNNEIIVELGKLCIEPSKWAWVLHADLLCINLDGGVLDACVIALVAALKNCKFILQYYLIK